MPDQVNQLAGHRNLVRELLHQVQHLLVLPNSLLRCGSVLEVGRVVSLQLLDQSGEVKVVRAVVRRPRAVGVAGREGGNARGLPRAVGGAEEPLGGQAAGGLGALDGGRLALVPLVTAARDALASREGQGLGRKGTQGLDEYRCFWDTEPLGRGHALLRHTLQKRGHIRHRRPLQLQCLQVHERVRQAELLRQRVRRRRPVPPQERQGHVPIGLGPRGPGHLRGAGEVAVGVDLAGAVGGEVQVRGQAGECAVVAGVALVGQGADRQVGAEGLLQEAGAIGGHRQLDLVAMIKRGHISCDHNILTELVGDHVGVHDLGALTKPRIITHHVDGVGQDPCAKKSGKTHGAG
mmetsp:Transcript_28127/g.62033  ORF Transcript_28127/g.62033 Transcript_28127/m.62033 type:complete len:349 (+) Transcript_28127:1055-2101(+)